MPRKFWAHTYSSTVALQDSRTDGEVAVFYKAALRSVLWGLLAAIIRFFFYFLLTLGDTIVDPYQQHNRILTASLGMIVMKLVLR